MLHYWAWDEIFPNIFLLKSFINHVSLVTHIVDDDDFVNFVTLEIINIH